MNVSIDGYKVHRHVALTLERGLVAGVHAHRVLVLLVALAGLLGLGVGLELLDGPTGVLLRLIRDTRVVDRSLHAR